MRKIFLPSSRSFRLEIIASSPSFPPTFNTSLLPSFPFSSLLVPFRQWSPLRTPEIERLSSVNAIRPSPTVLPSPRRRRQRRELLQLASSPSPRLLGWLVGSRGISTRLLGNCRSWRNVSSGLEVVCRGGRGGRGSDGEGEERGREEERGRCC